MSIGAIGNDFGSTSADTESQAVNQLMRNFQNADDLISALLNDNSTQETEKIFADLDKFINKIDKQIDKIKAQKNRDRIRQELVKLNSKLEQLLKAKNLSPEDKAQISQMQGKIAEMLKKIQPNNSASSSGGMLDEAQPEDESGDMSSGDLLNSNGVNFLV